MTMLKEFKEFALRGNVVDMAVGIVVGAAFGKIVSSLVNDVIMPPLGAVIGNIDFSGLSVAVAEGRDGPVVIKYGLFINTVLDFLIVALAIFMVVKAMNTVRRSEAKKDEPAPRPDQGSATTDRDPRLAQVQGVATFMPLSTRPEKRSASPRPAGAKECSPGGSERERAEPWV